MSWCVLGVGACGQQAARAQSSSWNLQVDAHVRVSVSVCVLPKPFFHGPMPFSTAVRYKNSLPVNSHWKPNPLSNCIKLAKKLVQVSLNFLGKPRGTFWPIQCWPLNPQIPFSTMRFPSFALSLPPLLPPSLLLLLVLGTLSGCKRCSCEQPLKNSACGLMWQDRWSSRV